ncbi:MAG TPA: ATP-binding cassette domain-containing protein, partial [Treponemataceae bacterium]|nr:ATP-binding cassette domain-containing protein [Treponemataceae bacterium]
MTEVVQVEGLSKSYGPVCAVSDLSFTVHSGEIFGIVGPNGAGKTTSIECILGTRRKDSGIVRMLGMDPVRDRRAVFAQVGVQFQDSAW